MFLNASGNAVSHSHCAGHCCGALGALRCASQARKKSANGLATVSLVTAGAFAASFDRGEGRICRKTLSPVVFGLVCVPWKWMLVKTEPLKQSGSLSEFAPVPG